MADSGLGVLNGHSYKAMHEPYGYINIRENRLCLGETPIHTFQLAPNVWFHNWEGDRADCEKKWHMFIYDAKGDRFIYARGDHGRLVSFIRNN